MKILTVLLLLLIICGSLIPKVSPRPIRRGHRNYGHARHRNQNRHGRQNHANNHNHAHAHPIARVNYNVEIFQVGRGPESLAFDSDGKGPYYGTADGAIERLEGNGSVTHIAYTNPNRPYWCNYAPDIAFKEQTCGRPLGMIFNNKDEAFIADSSLGVLMMDADRNIHTLVNGYKGTQFKFVNGMDYDNESMTLYFSVTSLNYHRWQFEEAMNPSNNDKTGMLFSYNMRTNELKLLISDLSFANGVVLGQNMDFVLVAETTAHRIQRYWLKGPQEGTYGVWMEGIGNPDGLRRNEKGEIWITQNYPPLAMRVDENANILEIVRSNAIPDASDTNQHNGTVWVGTVMRDVIVKFSKVV